MVDFSDEFFEAMTSSSNDKRNQYFVDFINRLDNKTLPLNNKSYDTYFLSFEILSDINEPVVKKMGFKAYRKLVAKRAMSGLMKPQEARSIAVICFSNLGDQNVMSRCTRIIDDVFYSFIKEFTLVLNNIIIPSHDYNVLLGTVNWLLQPQILQDKVFDFSHIIPSIIKAMNFTYTKKSEVYQILMKLLKTFFQNSPLVGPSNKIAYNEVQDSNIAAKVRDDVLSIIEVRPNVLQTEAVKLPYSSPEQGPPADYTAYAQLGLKSPFVTDKPRLEKSKPDIPFEIESADPEPSLENSHLLNLISKLDQYETESPELSPIDDCDLADLSKISKKYLPYFNGKESEHNWSLREECIRQLRRIVRGNVVEDYLDDFKSFISSFVDAIAKSVESLRTTLSSSACHLIKEMAIIMKKNFDSLTDLFLQPLINVCLRKKSITSRIAHTVISAIFINCSYHPKYLVKIKSWLGERSDTVFHSFCAQWLQILIIRFHSIPSLFNKVSSQYTSGPRVPLLHEMLKTLLSDANVLVRQAAREAFWEVCTFSPKDMQLILSSVDAKTQKMIEREKPSNISLSGKISGEQMKVSRNPSISSSLAMAPTLTLAQKVLSRANSRSSSQRSFSRTSSLMNKTTTSRPPSRTITSGSQGYTNPHSASGNPSYKPITKADHSTSRSLIAKPSIQKFSSKSKSTVPGVTEVPHYARPTKAQEKLRRNIVQSQHPFRDESTNELQTPQKNNVSSPEVSQPINVSSEYPLVDQLTSSDTFVINQGINGLKYALKYNEESEIPLNINEVISKLSKTHIQQLRPLFEYTGIPKVLRAFKTDDFLRVSSIIFDAPPHSYANEVCLFYGNVALYNGINKVLHDCLSSIEILKVDPEYGKQLAINKPKIIKFTLSLLNENIEMASSEECLQVCFVNLFKAFKIIPSDLFVHYSQLLNNMHSQNQMVFDHYLELFDMDYKHHLQALVSKNVESVSSFEPSEGLLQDSDDEIEIFDKEQNNKDDMKIDTLEHEIIETQEDVVKGDFQEQEKANLQNEGIEAEDIISIHAAINEEKNDVNDEDMDVDNDKCLSEENAFLESKSRRGSSLADEFSQIEIIDKKSFEIKDPYQSLVERVDPLKAKSDRGKQINIYHDKGRAKSSTPGSSSGSPVRVTMDSNNHDYSELNWFNFQLAHHPRKLENEINKNDYEKLIDKLSKGIISDEEVIDLANILQCSLDVGLDFTNYFCKEGKSILESSLWKYFEIIESHWYTNCPLELQNTSSLISNGLIIIKQTLICNINLDVNKLMNILHLLSNHTEDLNEELNYAINEIADELFKKAYFNLGDIFNHNINYIKQLSLQDNKNKILIHFEILLKILDKYNVYLANSTSTITDLINNDINKFLKHEEVDIRRLAVLVYAKFCNLANEEQNVNFLNNLNVSQKKLVDYYVKNS